MSAPVPVMSDRSSLERVLELLVGRLAGYHGGDQAYAHCPSSAHSQGDRNPSLSITWRDDRHKGGMVLLNCHAPTCSRDAVLEALGLSLVDLYDTPPARQNGASSTRSRARATKPARNPSKDDAPRPRVASPERPKGRRPSPIATHVYARSDGTRAYAVLRYVPTEEYPQKYGVRRYDQAGERILSGAAGRKAPPPAERLLYNEPAVTRARSTGDPVYVCEGEKDADTATRAYGVVATTNPFGACADANAGRRWLPQYTESLRGAHVVLVPDLDRPCDPGAEQPRRGVQGFRHALYVAEQLDGIAASVAVRIPAVQKDLTDHCDAGYDLADLAVCSVEEIRNRVAVDDAAFETAAAEPASAPSEPEQVGGKVIPFPGEHQQDEPSNGGGGSGGSDGGSSGGSDDGGGPEPGWQTVLVRPEYEARADGLFQVKYEVRDGRKTRKLTEVLPYRVRVTNRLQEVFVDESEPEVTHYDLVASHAGEEVVLKGVSRRRWDSCSWVSELPWAARAPLSQASRERLQDAIFRTSEPSPALSTSYGSMGWQQIDGRWRYVHAAGAIDSDGPVEGIRVTVPEELSAYAFTTPAVDAVELREAVDASVMALYQLPPRIVAPLLGAAYRACIGQSRTTAMLVGGPALGKTGAALYAVQHYAPAATHEHLPGGGSGEEANTTAALEELRFLAGDMLLTLDDLAPDRGPERASARGAAIARSQFNGYGKGRQRREGGFRARHRPRSLPLLSAEQPITVTSAETRVVSVPVYRGDIDTDVLASMTDPESARLRNVLIATMVQHYGGPMTEWIRERRAELSTRLRIEQGSGLDARHADSVADLAVGCRAMLDMAEARGAITPEWSSTLWEQMWAGLVECKKRLTDRSAARMPADRFRELVSTLLVRRDVSLAAKDGGVPPDPSSCGWQQSSFEQSGWRQVGTPIGWIGMKDGGLKVWLNPGATFAAIDRQATHEREPLNLHKDALEDALVNADVLKTRTVREKKTGRVRIKAQIPVRVGPEQTTASLWQFDHDWLLMPTDEVVDDDSGGDSPEGGTDGDLPAAPAPTNLPPAPTPDQVPSAAETPAGQLVQQPTVPKPATVPEASESRTEPSGQRRRGRYPVREVPEYAGLAVVCDASAAWLAIPGAEATTEVPDPEAVELPVEDWTVSGLLSWASNLNLGHVDGRGRYRGAPLGAGQVWVLPKLRRALGWPANLERSSNRAKVEDAIREAGWTLDRSASAGPWMRISRGQHRLLVVVPDWLTVPPLPMEGTKDPRTVAVRLAQYATVTGIAFVWAPSATGQQLIAVTRPRLLARKPQEELPNPAFEPRRESAFNWTREPTADEAKLPWAHLWDWNGLYLGAAASVPLAWGPYVHVNRPEFDPGRPGYWRVRLPEWEHARLPDPFLVCERGDRETVWVTTPTLQIARELLELDVQPSEAYLAAEQIPHPAKRDEFARGYGRLLDKWQRELAAGRTAVQGPDSSTDDVVRRMVKETYAHGIGRLDALAIRGTNHPLYRPDFRHAVIAQSRFAIFRRVLQAAEKGHFPLAIQTDGLVFASEHQDPTVAVPPGFRYSAEQPFPLGHVKHEGVAPMADVVPVLRNDGQPVDGGPGMAELIRNGGVTDG